MPVIRPQSRLNKILERFKDLFKENIGIGVAKDRDVSWIRTRDYSSYNSKFQKVTGISIVQFLANIARKKNEPIKVLDDGAGEGGILAGSFEPNKDTLGLKRRLQEQGIKSDLTAVALKSNIHLSDAKKPKTN